MSRLLKFIIKKLRADKRPCFASQDDRCHTLLTLPDACMLQQDLYAMSTHLSL
jgi:hypothetical protein